MLSAAWFLIQNENNIKYQWIDIFEVIYARDLGKTH